MSVTTRSGVSTRLRLSTRSLRRLVSGLTLTVVLAATATATARADAVGDYNVAHTFYKQQRWAQAEAEFRKFLGNYPDHERTPAARLYLGQSLVHQQKFDEARDVFRTFVNRHAGHPDLPLALYRIGESSYFLKDNEQARNELDRFISAYPEHELAEWALHYLGETQLRMNDTAAAIATFRLQTNRFPQGRLKDDARFLQAKAYELDGQNEQACQIYTALVSEQTGNRAADAQLELGKMHYGANEFQQAAAAFDALRDNFPQSPLVPLADLNAGYALYRLENYDEAIRRFERAAQSEAQQDEASFWIGMSHKSRGDFTAAAEVLRELTGRQTDPASASRARFHWADAALRAGQYDVAQQEFLRIANETPPGPLAADALHLATETALMAKDLDTAAQLDEQFRERFPQHGLTLLQDLLRGRIDMARGDEIEGDPRAAQTLYQRAADIFSTVQTQSKVQRTAWLARLLLARTQDRLDRPADMIVTLTPLVEHLRLEGDNEFAEALILQTRGLLKAQRNESAAETAQLYLDRFPGGPQTGEALAQLALAQARLDHAEAVDKSLSELWLRDDDRPLAQRTTYQIAEAAYQAKQWDRAARLFKSLIDNGAGQFEIPAYSGRAYALLESGQHAEAAEAFAELSGRPALTRVQAVEAARMHAHALRQTGELDAAATAFNDVITHYRLPASVTDPEPEDLEVAATVAAAARSLARLERDRQQREPADSAYAVAIEQTEKLPAARQEDLDQLLYERALLHYAAENYERSDTLFEQLIAIRPRSEYADDARLYLAESDFFSKRVDEAKPALEQLAKSAQADDFVRHRALVLLLDITADQEDWEALVRFARDLQKGFPESEESGYASYRLGQALLQSQNPRQAAEKLESLHQSTDPAIRNAPWFPSVRLLLARAYLDARQYDQVDAVIERFREEDPQSPYLYQADEILGRRLVRQSRFEEARTVLARVVDSETGRRTETAAQAQLLIAESYLLQEQYEQALTEYYKVYANYDYPELQAPALYQAAKCDEKLERWDGAVKTYTTLIDEFPGSEFATRAEPELAEARKKAEQPQ